MKRIAKTFDNREKLALTLAALLLIVLFANWLDYRYNNLHVQVTFLCGGVKIERYFPNIFIGDISVKKASEIKTYKTDNHGRVKLPIKYNEKYDFIVFFHYEQINRRVGINDGELIQFLIPDCLYPTE